MAEKCCFGGKPATRSETIAGEIIIPRFKGPINVGDQTVTLVAENVPHCDAHTGGVAFGRIMSLAATLSVPYGPLFRSLACRNEFRALNRWNWTLH